MRSYKNNFPYSSYAHCKANSPWMTCESTDAMLIKPGVSSSPKLPEQQAHVPHNGDNVNQPTSRVG